MNDQQKNMRDCYGSANCKNVLASAAARMESPCRFVDNPNIGVQVVYDHPQTGDVVLVELTETEKSLLLIEVGKAFAKLLRL